MDKRKNEKDIPILYSISELAEFLKENEGCIISVQIELDEGAVPHKQGGDSDG